MEFDALVFNLFGNKTIAKMMERDGLPHNRLVKMTAERLFELSRLYDVTVRIHTTTHIFLALQATYLPGDYSE
ncbi:hypothetical protein M0R72_01000 [Candidatus Pacearchaeota archaeon]|jgi:hypothetical protein|nr:hypothetical protein [Candidatus Pacearchaeota archaeon]